MIIYNVLGTYILLVKNSLRYYSGKDRTALLDQAFKDITA